MQLKFANTFNAIKAQLICERFKTCYQSSEFFPASFFVLVTCPAARREEQATTPVIKARAYHTWVKKNTQKQQLPNVKFLLPF